MDIVNDGHPIYCLDVVTKCVDVHMLGCAVNQHVEHLRNEVPRGE